jgi:hypothetical protein
MPVYHSQEAMRFNGGLQPNAYHYGFCSAGSFKTMLNVGDLFESVQYLFKSRGYTAVLPGRSQAENFKIKLL